jgi:hypothetical protein
LKKSLRVRARLGDPLAARGESWLAELRSRSPPLSADSVLEGEAIQLLKEWSQLVTAHYDIQVTLSYFNGTSVDSASMILKETVSLDRLKKILTQNYRTRPK